MWCIPLKLPQLLQRSATRCRPPVVHPRGRSPQVWKQAPPSTAVAGNAACASSTVAESVPAAPVVEDAKLPASNVAAVNATAAAGEANIPEMPNRPPPPVPAAPAAPQPPPPKPLAGVSTPPPPTAPKPVSAAAENASGAAAAGEGIPPAVAAVSIEYDELKALRDGIKNKEITAQAPNMMNIALKSLRDEAQGSDPKRWANPEKTFVDLTRQDIIFIRVIDRSPKGPDYNWIKDRDTGEYIKGQPFSIKKMLADSHVFDQLFMNEEKTEDGVCERSVWKSSIWANQTTIHGLKLSLMLSGILRTGQCCQYGNGS